MLELYTAANEYADQIASEGIDSINELAESFLLAGVGTYSNDPD
jgi:hypothetical protein